MRRSAVPPRLESQAIFHKIQGIYKLPLYERLVLQPPAEIMTSHEGTLRSPPKPGPSPRGQARPCNDGSMIAANFWRPTPAGELCPPEPATPAIQFMHPKPPPRR